MSSEKTPNLQLHRWQASDYVLRTEFNDNFAKIDDHAKQVTEHLAEIEIHLEKHGLDVTKFGAVADDTTDNTQIFRDVLSLSKTFNLPVFVPKGQGAYLLNGFATLSDSENVHIYSNGATIKGKGFKLTNVKNVKVCGFHFKGKNFTSSSFDDAVNLENCERVSISDNIIDSCFVRYRSTDALFDKSGIKILNNFFIGDTLGAENAIGANLIEVYGCKDVLIDGNSFTTLNTYRTIKISSAVGITGNVSENGYTDILRITNNYFSGSVNFKQVIDLYCGIDNLFVHDNTFDTKGASCLLESKIAGSGGELTQTTLREVKLYNNKIKIQDTEMNDMFRLWSYSYSSIDTGIPTFAHIYGNSVENSTNTDVTMFNVRGFSKVSIGNNSYMCKERGYVGAFYVIQCFAVGELSVFNNSFDVGSIGVFPATTTSNPDVSYSGSLKILKTSNNIFKDVRGSGGIFLRHHDSIDLVSINGDIITGDVGKYADLLACVYIRDCVAKTVSVQGVMFEINDSVRHRALYIDSTINSTIESNNSWNVTA